MTPKEKAEELVNKYYQRVADGSEPEDNAKQCALIAVDEILYMLENGLYDVNIRGDEYDGGFDMVEYWEQVKQEIENL